MNKRHSCFAIFLSSILLIASTLRGADARELVVVDKGESPYVIAVAAKADADRIAEAALLLQETVAAATGVELPVVNEAAVASGTPAIYLGKSDAARRAGLPVDDIRGFAALNRTVGQDIFLIGEDGSGTALYGLTAQFRGELKSVTTFLEQQVGVRFLLPGAFGRQIPKRDRLTVSAALDVTASSPFAYITGRSGRDPAYDAANNYFGNRLVRSYGGHSYYDAVPTREYGKSHPQYFALIGGVRTPKDNHLCITNPEVQELMLKKMEEELDRGYEWVELAQTDGYRECECKACRAIHPDRGERLWIVHRKLAAEMQQRRPDGKVMIISYGPTVAPPVTFDRFPDNVVVQLCRYTKESFQAWEPFHVAKTVYIYNWMAVARIAPGYAVEQIRRFVANDVSGIYICGGLATGGAWGLDGPTYYAFGKAIGDPSLSARDLTHEYVTAAFGKAAVPMQAFFGSLHGRTAIFGLLDRQRGFSPDAGDWMCHFFSPKVLGDMTASLDRALPMAEDKQVKARLAQVEAEFKAIRNAAAVYHMYRTYRLAPTWETLGTLETAVRDYRDTLAWLKPEGKMRTIPGLRPPFSGRPRLPSGAPFSWNFDLLREKRVLPGVGMQRAEAQRVASIHLDGRLDEETWRRAPSQGLSEIGMGPLEDPSHFKLAYDEHNLYIAFEAEIPSGDTLDGLRPVGRDGSAWDQENVELMIDPFGTRQSYCHLMFNPVPESRYDRRFGYEKDPLHPLFDKFDPDWNGEWDYAAIIDPERNRWTAEVRIPFDALGAVPPAPGAMWTMNVGRTQRPGDGKNPILSLWSPNLESRSFHDRTTFGEITFR